MSRSPVKMTPMIQECIEQRNLVWQYEILQYRLLRQYEMIPSRFYITVVFTYILFVCSFIVTSETKKGNDYRHYRSQETDIDRSLHYSK